jgi:hypothetical protein
MRKLLLWGLLASAAWAQTPQTITTTSASTPSGCASIDVTGNKGAVGLYVGGTWTGTLQPEVQVANQAPTNSYVIPSTSTTTQTTITANGNYFFPSSAVAGASTVLLCGPTSTGTANVYLQTSTALNVPPGSGGGGGSVSSVFGRTGAVTANTGDYTCAQVTNCTYSWFGNTANPLTSLVDPTSISDPTNNYIEFTSGVLYIGNGATEGAGNICAFTNGGATECQDAAGDIIDLNSSGVTLADAAVDAKMVVLGGAVTATGKVVTSASSTSSAGFNLPPGTAPSSPANGDCWTTSGGLYCQIAGSTIGPYGTGNYTFFGNTANPLTSLADPTNIVDGSHNYIAFSSSSVVIGAGVFPGLGNLCSFNYSSGAVYCADAAGDSLSLSAGAVLGDSTSDQISFNSTAKTATITTTNGTTFVGKLITQASASATAGFNLPPGAAPSSPANGDCWTTSAGLYCQIAGSTVGPYGTGGGVSSVSNSDGTLTVSPTTGAVVASLALGHANTWTGTQTFGTITPTTVSGNVNFSGAPTLTASPATTDNTTKIATTAFVNAYAPPAVILTSLYSNSTTSLTTVVTSGSLPANTWLSFHCAGTYYFTTNTEKFEMGVTASQTPQTIIYTGVISYALNGVDAPAAGTSSGAVLQNYSAAATLSTNYMYSLDGAIQTNATTGGTIAFGSATSSASGTVNINPGAYCIVYPLG